jgi:hypothetical protein
MRTRILSLLILLAVLWLMAGPAHGQDRFRVSYGGFNESATSM